MMNKTKIDWCDMTWNPITGCLHGCKYCYARGIAQRFAGYWNEERQRHLGCDSGLHDLEKAMHRHTKGKNRNIPVHSIQAPYPYGFDPTLHRYRLDEPQKIKKPQNIFVGSMADIFGEWVPDEWIQKVFDACALAPHHTYLFLTKNPARYLRIYEDNKLPDAENFWFGTTCTRPSDAFAFAKKISFKCFVSIEPILEPFGTRKNREWPDWIIIGAETGNRKDKITPERAWVEDIINQCKKANVSVFMKNNLAKIWGEPLMQEFPWEPHDRY